MRNRCPVCRGWYTPAASGRPSAYCSTPCRSRRDDDLRQAALDLARNSTPRGDDVPPALDRAEALLAVWLGHHDLGRVALRRELVDVHWLGNRPPRRLDPPDERAVRALLARVAELRQLVAQHEAEQRRLRDAERAKDAARRDRQTRRQARAADVKWRQQLLTSGGTS